MFLSKGLVSLNFNKVCKCTILIALVTIITMCFTFNAFGMDIPVVSNNPQIVIDGKDTEFAWVDSNRVIFNVSTKIASTASLEVLSYKNTVYGLMNLTDVVESETDLVVRIDFYHQNKSTYVIFAMKNQSVLYSDGDFYVAGMSDINGAGYCVEFSFSTKSASFKQGDLVKLEVRYGSVVEVDNYETVQGFSEKIVYDYYIGGKLPEKVPGVNSNKTQKPNNNTKTTTKSNTANITNGISVELTNFDVNEFANYGYSDSRETTVIIAVMVCASVVSMIIFCSYRKQIESRKPDYTDDDKGCD